jgi:RNA polymerase-associated protein RTF1
MADLDAELLALAGDDSSGEEGSLPSPRERSSSPPPPTRNNQDSSADMGRKGIAKPVAKSARRGAKKRKTYSDDEDL